MPEIESEATNGQTAYDRLTKRLTQKWYPNPTEAARAINQVLGALDLNRIDLANQLYYYRVFNECVGGKGSGKAHPVRDDGTPKAGKTPGGGSRRRRARY